MGTLIDDEILNTFAVVGPPEQIAPELSRRYGDVIEPHLVLRPVQERPGPLGQGPRRHQGRLSMYGEFFPMLATRDLGPMLHFYRDLLGFEQTYQFPARRRARATSGCASASPSWASAPVGDDTHGEPRRMSFCIYAHDCVEAVSALRDAGIAVLADPEDQPCGERMARVRRPRRQRRGDHAAAPQQPRPDVGAERRRRRSRPPAAPRAAGRGRRPPRRSGRSLGRQGQVAHRVADVRVDAERHDDDRRVERVERASARSSAAR